MKLKLWVAALALGTFAFSAMDASALRLHVSKSYPAWDAANNGKANQLAVGINPDNFDGDNPALFEFGVNSLIDFMKIARYNKWGGQESIRYYQPGRTAQEPDSTAHEIIFEDSSVYDIAAECQAAETAGNKHNIAWAESDNWHGENVLYDVVIKAGPAAKPVIKMTDMPGGGWGRLCFFGTWNYNDTLKPTGANVTVQGLTFVATTGGNETHILDVQSKKSKHPIFKDCVFDWQVGQELLRYCDDGSAALVDPGVAEFQHCAFRVKERSGSMINVHNAPANWDYILDFANCTFVNIGTNDVRMVDGHSSWDDGSGKAQGEGATFTKCIFQNFSGAVRWDFKARLALNNCIVWNPLNKGAWAPQAANGFSYPSTPGDVTKMTGNLAAPGTMTVDTGYGNFGFASGTKIADPLFADVNAEAFYLLTEASPAAQAGVYNIGYDMETVPVELSNFSAE